MAVAFAVFVAMLFMANFGGLRSTVTDTYNDMRTSEAPAVETIVPEGEVPEVPALPVEAPLPTADDAVAFVEGNWVEPGSQESLDQIRTLGQDG